VGRSRRGLGPKWVLPADRPIRFFDCRHGAARLDLIGQCLTYSQDIWELDAPALGRVERAAANPSKVTFPVVAVLAERGESLSV
jgi:hypothetical protein